MLRDDSLRDNKVSQCARHDLLGSGTGGQVVPARGHGGQSCELPGMGPIDVAWLGRWDCGGWGRE